MRSHQSPARWSWTPGTHLAVVAILITAAGVGATILAPRLADTARPVSRDAVPPVPLRFTLAIEPETQTLVSERTIELVGGFLNPLSPSTASAQTQSQPSGPSEPGVIDRAQDAFLSARRSYTDEVVPRLKAGGGFDVPRPTRDGSDVTGGSANDPTPGGGLSAPAGQAFIDGVRGLVERAMRGYQGEIVPRLSGGVPATAVTEAERRRAEQRQRATEREASDDAAARRARQAAVERERQLQAEIRRREREAAEARRRAEREQAERERQARLQAARERAAELARERAERERAVRLAREQAERERATRLAQEQADRERTKRLARERADRERAARLSEAQARREQAERERQQRERAAQAERERLEQARRETAEARRRAEVERRARERAAVDLRAAERQVEQARREAERQRQAREAAERKARTAAETRGTRPAGGTSVVPPVPRESRLARLKRERTPDWRALRDRADAASRAFEGIAARMETELRGRVGALEGLRRRRQDAQLTADRARRELSSAVGEAPRVAAMNRSDRAEATLQAVRRAHERRRQNTEAYQRTATAIRAERRRMQSAVRLAGDAYSNLTGPTNSTVMIEREDLRLRRAVSRAEATLGRARQTVARAPTDISDSIEPVAVASCATRRPTGATPELPVRRTNPPPSSGGVRAAVRAARRGLEPNTPAAETSSDRTLPRPVIVAGGEQRLTRRNTATSSTQPRRAARPAASRKRSARSRRARARRVASYRKRTRRNRRHARGRAYRRRCYRAGVLVRRGRKYVVRRGDTLWRIARRHYGRGIKYHRIFRANRRKIRNPHLIYPCQRFRVPRR